VSIFFPSLQRGINFLTRNLLYLSVLIKKSKNQAMSNSLLKFKFTIKSALGLIPGTSRLELKDLELRKEHEDFLRYEESGGPKRFLELEEIVTSQDFADRKKYIESQRFKDTDAYHKMVEYNRMKKSSEFRGYFKITSAREFDDFMRINDSRELKEFQELESYVNSREFRAVKKSRFKDSAEWRKYLEYKNLKNTKEIKDYFKIKHSGNYKALKELEGSKKLSHYEQLHQMVNSAEFLIMKKTLSSGEFKKTTEYDKYREYLALKSEPDIKAYLKIQEDKAFANFRMMENTPELENYIELEKFVNSAEFRNAKREFELKKATELHKLNDYKTLKKSVKFKSYNKIKNSRDLRHFQRLRESPELERYFELDKYINSNEFRETKAWMESKDKFRKSPEYQQLQEYRELKKSSKLKWYNKVKKSTKFEELRKWKLTFTDDFTGNELDKDKWLTKYFWGDQLLNQSYSLATDRHFYKEENITVENSILRLNTKKETISGQAWDAAIGFFPKEFDFTSAMVNTGHHFRQQYGAFEAKVRMRASPSVFHAFWMVSDKAVPHIDIFRFSGNRKKRVGLNIYHEDNRVRDKIVTTRGNIGGLDFSRGYFIFRLEWYPGRLVWKINNTVVKIEDDHVPDVPMYILFSSGIEDDAGVGALPATMDVDWVRCFRLEEKDQVKTTGSTS
jgi:beta-glucanase (GH16 family)